MARDVGFLKYVRHCRLSGIEILFLCKRLFGGSVFSLEKFGRLVVGDEYVELFDVFSSFSVLRGC